MGEPAHPVPVLGGARVVAEDHDGQVSRAVQRGGLDDQPAGERARRGGLARQADHAEVLQRQRHRHVAVGRHDRRCGIVVGLLVEDHLDARRLVGEPDPQPQHVVVGGPPLPQAASRPRRGQQDLSGIGRVMPALRLLREPRRRDHAVQFGPALPVLLHGLLVGDPPVPPVGHPLADDHERRHQHEQGIGPLVRHLHHDHAEDHGDQRREQLQPHALAALGLRGHLDPRRPRGRRDPRRPVVGEPAAVGGQMCVRWLRFADLKHVGADLQSHPERDVALPGRLLSVHQEWGGVRPVVQRFEDHRHAGAAWPDRQPRHVGRQPDAPQPDVAVRRRAHGHGAVAEPVHHPRGRPADEPDLDHPGWLAPAGRACGPLVE